jgi:5-deoxy-glucuronate isomerase
MGLVTTAATSEVLLEPPRLGVIRGAGAMTARAEGCVAWVLVDGGGGVMTVDGERVEVSPRRAVFAEPGWSAYLGSGSTVAFDGDLTWTAVWREDSTGATRIIDPATISTEDRGSGASARRVRTYLPEGRIIAGETLNPPGGWSSYPPHRHEHEEVYLYRFAPSDGFGVAVEYDDRDAARVVRDGSVQRITSGYHPVVAAPGYEMYYLWALAGDSDVLTSEFDPVHAHLG